MTDMEEAEFWNDIATCQKEIDVLNAGRPSPGRLTLEESISLCRRLALLPKYRIIVQPITPDEPIPDDEPEPDAKPEEQ